jgi:phosphoglycolate phosphatase-like HAD superfamily hydrolase
MIGDKLIDIDAGEAAGVSTVLVLTGYGAREAKHTSSQQCVATNLLEAVTEFVLPRNY